MSQLPKAKNWDLSDAIGLVHSLIDLHSIGAKLSNTNHSLPPGVSGNNSQEVETLISTKRIKCVQTLPGPTQADNESLGNFGCLWDLFNCLHPTAPDGSRLSTGVHGEGADLTYTRPIDHKREAALLGRAKNARAADAICRPCEDCRSEQESSTESIVSGNRAKGKLRSRADAPGRFEERRRKVIQDVLSSNHAKNRHVAGGSSKLSVHPASSFGRPSSSRRPKANSISEAGYLSESVGRPEHDGLGYQMLRRRDLIIMLHGRFQNDRKYLEQVASPWSLADDLSRSSQGIHVFVDLSNVSIMHGSAQSALVDRRRRSSLVS